MASLNLLFYKVLKMGGLFVKVITDDVKAVISERLAAVLA